MIYQSFFLLNQVSDESLYVTEIENAIDSLETALSFLSRGDNMKWKWLAIALDHSLYSFCIASVARHRDDVLQLGWDEDNCRTVRMGNDPEKRSTIVYRPTHSGAYTIQWHDLSSTNPPKTKLSSPRTKLITFWAALARVQDSYYWMPRCGAEPLALSADDWLAIEWIHNEVRNGLIHYDPTVISFPIHRIKQAAASLLAAIRFLAFDSHAVHYTHLKESQDRMSKSIQALANALKS